MKLFSIKDVTITLWVHGKNQIQSFASKIRLQGKNQGWGCNTLLLFNKLLSLSWFLVWCGGSNVIHEIPVSLVALSLLGLMTYLKFFKNQNEAIAYVVSDTFLHHSESEFPELYQTQGHHLTFSKQ